MEEKRPFAAKRIALSGILLAMAVIVLFMATVAPTGRLSLFVLSSFFVSIIVIELGVKTGWIFYISSCLLALIVIHNKLEILPYILFFGIYGLAKYYIEKLGRLVLEYILKLVFFNICLFAALYFAREFFMENIRVNLPWEALIVAMQVVFLIYDYVYTLFVQYYREKLKNLLRR